MASGTKQHFGLTVLSSNATEDGVTANYDNVTRKGGITGAGVAKINGKIGNRALFNSYEEENNPNPLGEPDARGLPPPKMAVKIGDVYADGFISKKDGAGLFLDLGADALKFESKYVDLGIGARCDTFAPEPPACADGHLLSYRRRAPHTPHLADATRASTWVGRAGASASSAAAPKS